MRRSRNLLMARLELVRFGALGQIAAHDDHIRGKFGRYVQKTVAHTFHVGWPKMQVGNV